MVDKKSRTLITGGSGMIGINISFGIKPKHKNLIRRSIAVTFARYGTRDSANSRTFCLNLGIGTNDLIFAQAYQKYHL